MTSSSQLPRNLPQLESTQSKSMKGMYFLRTDQIPQRQPGDVSLSQSVSEKRFLGKDNKNDGNTNSSPYRKAINNTLDASIPTEEERASSSQSKQGPRTFKFRELNSSNTGKLVLDMRQTKKLFTTSFDTKSTLYQQYLSTGVHTPSSSNKKKLIELDDKNINNFSPENTRRVGSTQENRGEFSRTNNFNKSVQNGFEINQKKKFEVNGELTPKIGPKSGYLGIITPNKMYQTTKGSSQGFGMFSTTNQKIAREPLLYPYLSKKDQSMFTNGDAQVGSNFENKKKKNSGHIAFSSTLLVGQKEEEDEGNESQTFGNKAFQRQKKAMLRMLAAEEKHTQSAQEKPSEEFNNNLQDKNRNSSFSELGFQTGRNKEGYQLSSRNPEGSLNQINDDEEEFNEKNYSNKQANNSFESLIDSPLSPPPKGTSIIAESQFRRSFNFISQGGAFNRKSFTKLPLKAATNLGSSQQQSLAYILDSARQQNVQQSGPREVSNTTSIHISAPPKEDIDNMQKQSKSSVSLNNLSPSLNSNKGSNSTANLSIKIINDEKKQTNSNIFNIKSLRLSIPPNSSGNRQLDNTSSTRNQTESNRSKETGLSVHQQQQPINEKQLLATKEEECEDENHELWSQDSIPSPKLLQKRKQIEESSMQENQLANLYMTSYKHISEILEENKFFNVVNSIEEDMLSTTVANQVLLPKKLGVLGTLRATIAQKKQIEEEVASANGFINLILSKTGKSQKQKLNLSRLSIGNAYAAMVAKALSHPDLSQLYSINLSFNHFDGGAVFKISTSLSESIQSIDLSNNNIGPTGTRGLIPLFDSKKYSFLKKLNLENNNIADLGLNTIIPSIFRNMSISMLNISRNKLSDASCTFIKRLLLNSSYLQELYLHWNKFSSYGGILIAQGLAENLNIKVLDLSHNGLGGVPKLRCGSKIIQSCNVLESAVRHLDVSYNQFSVEECQEMGIVLKANHTLYGVHMEGNQCQALIDPRGFLFFPEKNETKHMSDAQIIIQRIHSVKTMGPNKMQSFDCKAFDNCWICHGWMEIRFEISSESSDLFTGEPAFLHLDFEDYQPIYMDADPEDKSKFFLYRMCPPNRKISFFFSDPCKNVLYTSKGYQIEEFKHNEHMNLKLEDIHTKEPEKPQPVQTQPAVDTKKADTNSSKTKKSNSKQKPNKNDKSSKKKPEITSPKAQLEVVSPKKQSDLKKQADLVSPKQLHSKSTSNKFPAAGTQESDSDQEDSLVEDDVMKALDEIEKVAPKKFKIKYLDGTVIQYHTPKYVNTMMTSLNRDIISKVRDYDPVIKALPRQEETFFLITKSNLWHRGISLFRDYIPDSNELDRRCFEYDWASSKLPKLLEKGSDIGECKKILQSMYPMLRIAYKYLSSQGVTNDVFCITQNPFSTFAQRAQLIDNQLLYVRDIDFNFISASNIALKTKTYRNPDKALIRNEFLEIMGRIAMDKYVRNEKVKTNSEAINQFFHEEGLLNHLYEFDSPQEWRNTRYWNQECDTKLKEQLPFLKTLYNLVADSRKNEKRYFTNIKSMSMAEFKDMVNKYDLLDDFLVERDIALSFNLAMMTQVDELTVDRHFQMTFVEFLEALARLAEKKSMTPLGEISDEYSPEERIQIKLHYKIESLIALIKKKQEQLVLKENQGQKDANQQQQAAGFQRDPNKRLSTLQVSPSTGGIRKSIKTDEIPSTNFLRNLASKMKSMTEFDDEKEKSKMHLKNIISKIMHKEIILPPSLSPIPEDKQTKETKSFNLIS